MRFLLILSIALNFLLLTTIVAARVDTSRSSNLAAIESNPGIFVDAAALASSTPELIRQLNGDVPPAAVALHDAKALILGWLLVQAYNSYQPNGSRYWHADYSPALSSLAASRQIEGQVRQQLIALYGTEAAKDPVFDLIFRPLGSEYSFLSSDAQLHLQELQLTSFQARGGSGDRQAPQARRCEAGDTEPDQPSEWLATPELSTHEQREFQIRFSGLAQQLRQSQVANDEQEYRNFFDRLTELDRSPSPVDQARIRRSLRESMGNSDFDRFWSERDPFYQEIERYLQDQNLPQHQIERAYSIINQTQESMLSVITDHPNQASMLNEVGKLRRDEFALLAAVVGERVAQGLSAVLAQAAIRFSNVETVGC